MTEGGAVLAVGALGKRRRSPARCSPAHHRCEQRAARAVLTSSADHNVLGAHRAGSYGDSAAPHNEVWRDNEHLYENMPLERRNHLLQHTPLIMMWDEHADVEAIIRANSADDDSRAGPRSIPQ